MLRKLSLIVAAVVASVSLSGNVALANGQPALPSGDTLFEVPCADSAPVYQLHQLDFENNARVAVGTGAGSTRENECASQGAILPGTDWFYFIDFGSIGLPLVRVNLVSGAAEVIGETTDSANSANLYSLTIGPDGRAYALSDQYLYTVNLTTGASAINIDYDFGAESAGAPYGFAYDPTTEKFYVVDSGILFEFDVTTGIATRTDFNDGDEVDPNDVEWTGSMAFDSSGSLWMNGSGNYVSSTTLENFAASQAWEKTSAFSPDVYSESLALVRTESPDDDSEGLAATGADNLAMLGLAGALLVGTAVIVRRRRA
jgi:LPXTG-motif cell wall-anchored protein